MFFWPKKRISQNTPKICLMSNIYLLKRGKFSFAPLFPVVARTWLELRSVCLFGPNISVFGPKIRYLPHDPNFVNVLFVALREMVYFQPSERFFDFSFLTYGRFRKRTWLTRQKVLPLPTVGVPSASNSPSALSSQALRRAGLHGLGTFGVDMIAVFDIEKVERNKQTYFLFDFRV